MGECESHSQLMSKFVILNKGVIDKMSMSFGRGGDGTGREGRGEGEGGGRDHLYLNYYN